MATIFKEDNPGSCVSKNTDAMLINMSIWYPNGVFRSPVLDNGKYHVPPNSRPLPIYVVPPRRWPGINCSMYTNTQSFVTEQSSTLSLGDSSQSSGSSEAALDNNGPRITDTGSDRASPPLSNQSSTQSDPVPSSSSDNYRGDLANPANQSAQIPDAENCSIFVTELPSGLTYKMLFDSIRDVGKVSHCHINLPTADHRGAAAKLVFFDHEGVVRFFGQVNSGTLTVGGRNPRAMYNRIKARPMPTSQGRTSRVLKIYGPTQIINDPHLSQLLQNAGLDYNLESIETIRQNAKTTGLEYRFASCRAQSLRARAIIRIHQQQVRNQQGAEAQLWAQVRMAWGDDPCDRQ
ncbi:hypothetical protein F4810DRAFT_721141 [Camillea tinctor]|nr:hypothetical protein F4810DRAFT_721141 [Camillea tinctor]